MSGNTPSPPNLSKYSFITASSYLSTSCCNFFASFGNKAFWSSNSKSDCLAPIFLAVSKLIVSPFAFLNLPVITTLYKSAFILLPSFERKPFKLFLSPSTNVNIASSYSFLVKPFLLLSIFNKLLLPDVRFNIASLNSLPSVLSAVISSANPFAGSSDNSIDATFLLNVSVLSKLITRHCPNPHCSMFCNLLAGMYLILLSKITLLPSLKTVLLTLPVADSDIPNLKAVVSNQPSFA